MNVRFSDREEAGRMLADLLGAYARERPIVLALPRGGVPVGNEVAKALNAPLDIWVVRKIGAPGHEEYGIGAVVDGMSPHVVIDEEAAVAVGASRAYIQQEFTRQLAEIERRRALYRTGPTPPLKGRSVIMVDDGIATGGTVRAALKALGEVEAHEVVLAVPVAPQSVLQDLARLCSRTVYLAAPDPFYAVGAHYANFDQLEDAEVIELLARAKAARVV